MRHMRILYNRTQYMKIIVLYNVCVVYAICSHVSVPSEYSDLSSHLLRVQEENCNDDVRYYADEAIKWKLIPQSATFRVYRTSTSKPKMLVPTFIRANQIVCCKL